ncbi:Dps family protein [Salisediminibacterium selenitireducens]|uniref:Ferritin Dps family protein n=1 Tax=Bacillus selenitireducens (strain ATCC 700615 / DSM 15326 / MLS10) TaxID=439292 RepID=D6XY49_BACIE|nr:Dps family protein [Salisediminibacterium selenitireducens]ADH98122.1 Ferritin Dps family protein [[Bacillus] selenitireducens MLS10]
MAHVKTEEILNRHVSNWSVLFVKLHNYHWYVGSTQFFTLHQKFEELYNEAATNIDELAERLLAAQGNPVASMSEYLKTATVKEAEGETTYEAMLDTLIGDFDLISKELNADIATLEDEVGDDVTADMLIGIRQSVEKHNWMLRQYTR